MVEWAWVLAIAIVITVIQVLLYRRLRNRRLFDDGGPDQGTEQLSAKGENNRRDVRLDAKPAFEERQDATGRSDRSGDGRRCPACGTINAADDAYTYCYNCTGPLR